MAAKSIDPDDFFAKLVKGLLPIWGPFYALFYILRVMWKESLRRRESDREDLEGE
jgi:hypothetical protein